MVTQIIDIKKIREDTGEGDVLGGDIIKTIVKKESMRPVIPKFEFPRKGDKLKAGSVLILLEGENAGKRVVFLKPVEGKEGDYLLVTGLPSINGVGFACVEATSTITTSTFVDISSTDILQSTDSHNISELILIEKTKKKRTKFIEHIVQEEDNRYEDAQNKMKEVQEQIEKQLLDVVNNISHMKEYLASPLDLDEEELPPHRLKF